MAEIIEFALETEEVESDRRGALWMEFNTKTNQLIITPHLTNGDNSPKLDTKVYLSKDDVQIIIDIISKCIDIENFIVKNKNKVYKLSAYYDNDKAISDYKNDPTTPDYDFVFVISGASTDDPENFITLEVYELVAHNFFKILDYVNNQMAINEIDAICNSDD